MARPGESRVKRILMVNNIEVAELTITQVMPPINSWQINQMRALFCEMNCKSTFSTFDKCIHCGHYYSQHSFNLEHSTVHCMTCRDDFEVSQVTCYISSIGGTNSPLSGIEVIPVYFYASGNIYRINGTAKVTVTGDNPHDPNEDFEKHMRFEVWKTCNFLQEYLDAGGNFEDVISALTTKLIQLDGPEVTRVGMTPKNWEKFYARWKASGFSPEIFPPASMLKLPKSVA